MYRFWIVRKFDCFVRPENNWSVSQDLYVKSLVQDLGHLGTVITVTTPVNHAYIGIGFLPDLICAHGLQIK